jgi:hypothetical protein
MIPEVKKSLLELVDDVVKGTGDLPELNQHIFMDKQSQSGIWLTTKNYNSVKGVATQMHQSSAQRRKFFVCKGPQGKSLFNDLDNTSKDTKNKSLEGLFVAFSAGTGVFVFIDIVLRIFLQNYSQVFAR